MEPLLAAQSGLLTATMQVYSWLTTLIVQQLVGTASLGYNLLKTYFKNKDKNSSINW